MTDAAPRIQDNPPVSDQSDQYSAGKKPSRTPEKSQRRAARLREQRAALKSELTLAAQRGEYQPRPVPGWISLKACGKAARCTPEKVEELARAHHLHLALARNAAGSIHAVIHATDAEWIALQAAKTQHPEGHVFISNLARELHVSCERLIERYPDAWAQRGKRWSTTPEYADQIRKDARQPGGLSREVRNIKSSEIGIERAAKLLGTYEKKIVAFAEIDPAFWGLSSIHSSTGPRRVVLKSAVMGFSEWEKEVTSQRAEKQKQWIMSQFPGHTIINRQDLCELMSTSTKGLSSLEQSGMPCLGTVRPPMSTSQVRVYSLEQLRAWATHGPTRPEQLSERAVGGNWDERLRRINTWRKESEVIRKRQLIGKSLAGDEEFGNFLELMIKYDLSAAQLQRVDQAIGNERRSWLDTASHKKIDQLLAGTRELVGDEIPVGSIERHLEAWGVAPATLEAHPRPRAIQGRDLEWYLRPYDWAVWSAQLRRAQRQHDVSRHSCAKIHNAAD